MIKGGVKGFTIVEVLIVLAIAAAIIIVVLVAVPQLQRTNRNNAVKQDAKHILAAVNEFVTTNNKYLSDCHYEH